MFNVVLNSTLLMCSSLSSAPISCIHDKLNVPTKNNNNLKKKKKLNYYTWDSNWSSKQTFVNEKVSVLTGTCKFFIQKCYFIFLDVYDCIRLVIHAEKYARADHVLKQDQVQFVVVINFFMSFFLVAVAFQVVVVSRIIRLYEFCWPFI